MTKSSANLSRSHRIAFLLILLVALLPRVWLVAKVVPDGLFDDAYITLRYARNLIHGEGFVYNPGERVWGTTTPLFTLLLSGTGWIVGAHYLETIAVLFGVLASIGALVLTAWVLWLTEVYKPVWWIYVLCFALLPSFVTNSVSGMETPLVLFLMAWSLLCYVRGQWSLLGFVAGLLLLARVDTAIWLTVLAAHSLAERRVSSRDIGKAVGAFLLPTLPWFLFALFYFGTLIPQSVVGKAVSHGAFQTVDMEYTLAFLSTYFPVQSLGRFRWVAVTFGLVISALGIWQLWCRYPPLRPLGTFFVFYNAVFLLSRVPLFSWYFPPGEWAFYLLFLLGLQAIWAILRHAWESKVSSIAEQVAWMVLGGLVVLYSGRAFEAHRLEYTEPNIWAEVSAFLDDHTTREARIFLEHIGLVGYRSNRYIYDSMGLVTPDMVTIKQQYGQEWLATAIRTFAPDVVLLYRWESPDMTDEAHLGGEAGWFYSEYKPVAQFGNPEPWVTVFFRKDSQYVVNSGDQSPRDR